MKKFKLTFKGMHMGYIVHYDRICDVHFSLRFATYEDATSMDDNAIAKALYEQLSKSLKEPVIVKPDNR